MTDDERTAWFKSRLDELLRYAGCSPLNGLASVVEIIGLFCHCESDADWELVVTALTTALDLRMFKDAAQEYWSSRQ